MGQLNVEQEINSRFGATSFVQENMIAPVKRNDNQLREEGKAFILVVDDESDTVKTLKKILMKKGYKIQTAYNGLEAISKLYSTHFDLVITDLLMPKLDGIQLSRRVRQEWPSLPIIVVTALDDEHMHRNLLSIGVSAYLRKPFNREQLLNAVAEIIQLSAETANA